MQDTSRIPTTPEEWGDEFREQGARYERLAEKLSILVEELLEGAEIDHAPIEARVKSVKGFVEKINRKPDQYQNPLQDMPDLIGLRVVVYYQSDRQAVGDLIDNEFLVDWAQSDGEQGAQDPDRFGYDSAHYVVTLPDDRAGLSDWMAYRDMHAEIQVRTVLQHAWAAISHKLDYKSAVEVPKDLRRQLFRLSALMELADEQFQDLRQNTEQLEARYEQQVQGGDLEAEIDASSLETYLDVAKPGEPLIPIALDNGFEPWNDGPSISVSGRAALLNTLVAAGVKDLKGLDTLIQELLPSAPDIFARVAKGSTARGFVPVAVPGDLLHILILGSGRAGAEAARHTSFLAALAETLHEIAAATAPGAPDSSR